MTAGTQTATDLTGPRDAYVELLGRAAMREAVRLVADLAASGTTLDRIVFEVLAPAQVEVGRRWEAGRWSVAQEHTATGITEIALQAAVLASGADRQPVGDGSLVLACADGEWHALGARMAADVLRAAGVDVTFVGASLPVEALGDYLKMREPTALGLSCSTAMTLVGARESVLEAHRVGVPVLVSGSAFGGRASRAEAIGADGYAGELAGAAQTLADWSRTPPAPLRDPVVPEGDEWQRLSTAPGEWVEDASARLGARRPRLRSFSLPLAKRLEKETAYLMRWAAASAITADPSMLEDYTRWLHGVLRARKVPTDVVDDLYASVAEALDQAGRAPQAATRVTSSRALLADAAAGRGAPAGPDAAGEVE